MKKQNIKPTHQDIAYQIEKQDFKQFYSKGQLELYLKSIGFDIYVMDCLSYPTLKKIIDYKPNLYIDPIESRNISIPMWLSKKDDGFIYTYGRLFTIFEFKSIELNNKTLMKINIRDIDDGDNRFYKTFEVIDTAYWLYDTFKEMSQDKNGVLDMDLLKSLLLEYKFERE